jgi:hypothetical protein
MKQALKPLLNALDKRSGVDVGPALCSALFIISVSVYIQTARAAEPAYPREVARWQEIIIPSETDSEARSVWFYSANYSPHDWRVYTDGDHVCAALDTERPQDQKERPEFTPEAGQFRGASAFAAVDDGWLVGFNRGEWGGALFWFSRDGKQKYKVSDHQVVGFFSLTNGLHAIEGLAHLTMSKGSIIRIVRPQRGARWQALVVTKLPFAPYAISVRRDATMLVTLSNALVSVGKDYSVETLLRDPLWSGLCPNSSILSRDERKLYVGMRQFVGEFDLSAKKLRLLVPSAVFLNKLPKEDELRIRKGGW